jgi:hypothetical protein
MVRVVGGIEHDWHVRPPQRALRLDARLQGAHFPGEPLDLDAG